MTVGVLNMLNELKILQKEEAVKRLLEMDYFEDSLNEFISEDKISKSEPNGAIFWLSEDEQKIVDDFEKKWNALVFHVIHSFAQFGELYNLLYISKNEEEWSEDLERNEDGTFMSFVYVENVDCDWCSEFGSIVIKNRIGGLVRLV